MRLLFVSPYPPTPIRRRSYELLRRLARRHDVTLATVVGGPADAAAVAALAEIGVAIRTRPISPARRATSMAAAAMAGLPLQARFDWQPALAADLRALVAPPGRGARADRGASPSPRSAHGAPDVPGAPGAFDAVHVEHLRGAAYGLVVRGAAPGLPVVWDAVDCIARLFAQAARAAATPRARLIARLELARTRRYEAGLPARFAATAVTSAADRDALRALADASGARPVPDDRKVPGAAQPPIAVVPNGVDLERFAPPAAGGPPARDPDTVLFTGKLGYHANVAAALHLVHDVMPLVWARRPGARVVLAGAEPAPAVRALARPASAPAGAVVVTGEVPDLRPHLVAAAVVAVPLVYGVGIQNKVLEAMACAAPVVASPDAAAALAAVPGRDLLLGATPAELAAAIVALLDDPARAAAVGKAGRAYVERAHGWDAAVERFEALYRESGAAPAASHAKGAD